MATTQARPAAAVEAPSLDLRPPSRSLRTAVPALLALALGAITGYALFANGATGLTEEARVQVALAAIAVPALAAVLFDGGLRAAAQPLARPVLALLAGFAGWCALSITWSITPDLSWIEFNRAATYALVVALALAVGASLRRAPERVALGYLAIATVVALYAVGGKAIPWLEIPGILDLNHAEEIARLREPLGYWNALAIACAIAAPLGVQAAADAARTDRGRLAALLALIPLVVTTFLTLSRGGLIVLGLTLVALIGLSADRRRVLAFAGIALVASAPAVILGLTLPDLTADDVAKSKRVVEGLLLLAALVAGGLAAVALGRAAIRADDRLARTPGAGRAARRLAVAACVAGFIALVGGAALSDAGLTGAVDRNVSDITERRYDPQTPSRLIRTNSGNRWTWWKEAVGAASDHPIFGFGAGSFPAIHLLYRDEILEVKQPHSVPLEFLAETGLIGAGLGLGALALLGLAAATGARARSDPRQRGYALALLAATGGVGLHLFVDWDWDIPGVMLPALVFAGVLAARPRGTPPAAPVRGRPSLAPGPGAYALALGAGTLALCALAVSATLPALARDKVNDAYLASIAGGPNELEKAARDAAEAEKLDPLSVQPLLVGSSIAERRRDYRRAADLLLEATRRQPDNSEVWLYVTRLHAIVGDVQGIQRYAMRGLSVDLTDPALQLVYVLATVDERRSASATGTPLPTKATAPPPQQPAAAAPAPAAPAPVAPAPPAPPPAPAPTPAPAPAPAPPPQRPSPPPERFRSEG